MKQWSNIPKISSNINISNNSKIIYYITYTIIIVLLIIVIFLKYIMINNKQTFKYQNAWCKMAGKEKDGCRYLGQVGGILL